MCFLQEVDLPMYTQIFLEWGKPIRGYSVRELLEETHFRSPKFFNRLMFKCRSLVISKNCVLLNKNLQDTTGHKDQAGIIYHKLVHIAQLKDEGWLKYMFIHLVLSTIWAFLKCLGERKFPTPKNIRLMMNTFGYEREACFREWEYWDSSLSKREIIMSL